MTLALYHEARGESMEGQIGVAATILNRVASKAYPDSVCRVVFQNAARHNACQFSFACDSRSLMPRNRRSLARMARLAAAVLARTDGRGNIGAGSDDISRRLRAYIFVTHYHRYDVHPSWSRRMTRVRQTGAHVFFSSRRVVRRMPRAARIERIHALMRVAMDESKAL